MSVRVVPAVMCACGESSVAARLRVDWDDGPRCYWYCRECADDIIATIDGVVEVLP